MRMHKETPLGGILCRLGSTGGPTDRRNHWARSVSWDRVDCVACLKYRPGVRSAAREQMHRQRADIEEMFRLRDQRDQRERAQMVRASARWVANLGPHADPDVVERFRPPDTPAPPAPRRLGRKVRVSARPAVEHAGSPAPDRRKSP